MSGNEVETNERCREQSPVEPWIMTASLADEGSRSRASDVRGSPGQRDWAERQSDHSHAAAASGSFLIPRERGCGCRVITARFVCNYYGARVKLLTHA